MADSYPEARQVFDEADQTLGFPLSTLCFEGPEEVLKQTENTQPALLTVSIAAFRVLSAKGIRPDYVAGHSLGEYSALVAAGALSFSDAVRLVKKRGSYMQDAVPPGVGAMAALLKLPEGKLVDILGEASHGEIVSAANFNSPDQVVIAGHRGSSPRDGTGESRRGEAGYTTRCERAIPLRPHETGADADGAGVGSGELRRPPNPAGEQLACGASENRG